MDEVSVCVGCDLCSIVSFGSSFAFAQQKPVVWSADEKPIADQIHGLRALPDDVRAGTTKDLALKIRKLPSTENKLRLAVGLSGLSTEGDFGHDTLQEVATTLAETLRERPVPWEEPKDAGQEPKLWRLASLRMRMLSWPRWSGTSMSMRHWMTSSTEQR